MFEYCYSLTSSPQIIISEGATIDKSSVSCEGAFDRCTLVSIDVFCELGWPTLVMVGLHMEESVRLRMTRMFLILKLIE